MKIGPCALALLALLVSSACEDKVRDLFQKISQSLDESLEENRKKHAEIMQSADEQHDELKSLLQLALAHIDSATGKNTYDLIGNYTEEFREKIGDLRQQTDKHNDEVLEKSLNHTEEIRNLLLGLLRREDSYGEPNDCYELYQRGIRRNGVYPIKPKTAENFLPVFCDMKDGGWTVIQRRDYYSAVKEDFLNGTWTQFKVGFGDPSGEYWLGNEWVHEMTKDRQYELNIDMKSFKNVTTHARFGYFRLENETDKYRLRLGDERDTSLYITFYSLRNEQFQTNDNGMTCPSEHRGGWWFFLCNHFANLNGQHGNVKSYKSITFDGQTPLSNTVMKIRPKA